MSCSSYLNLRRLYEYLGCNPIEAQEISRLVGNTQEISWGTEEFSRGTQEFSRGTQEFSRGTEEFSRNPKSFPGGDGEPNEKPAG